MRHQAAPYGPGRGTMADAGSACTPCPPCAPLDPQALYLAVRASPQLLLPGLAAEALGLLAAGAAALASQVTLYSAAAALLVVALLPRGMRRALLLTLLWLPWIPFSLLAITLQWLVVLWTSVRILVTLVLFGAVRVARLVADAVSACALRAWQCRSRQGLSAVAGNFFLRRALRAATSFSEWEALARQLDEAEGGARWREEDEGDECDWQQLRALQQALRDARSRGDLPALMFELRKALHRDVGNAENPALFTRALAGTKHLLLRYQEEVTAALRAVRDADEAALPLQEKHAFLRSAKRALGRTALCLSGGGSLSMYHMGVIRTLLRLGLLPRIVSGTSGGAIPAALLGVYSDEEAESLIQPDVSSRFGKRWFEPLPQQLLHFLRHGVLMDSSRFSETVEAYFGKWTFAEAFARTQRRINISIATATSRSGHSRLLLLNHITAPNVIVSSAVVASCALPGLMRPVELLAKDPSGRVVPFFPDDQGVRFVDGSLQGDIPRQRLRELYNCNRFVVSQVNPHVVPFIGSSRIDPREAGWLGRLELLCHLDLRASVHKLSRLRLVPFLFGQDVSQLFRQHYSGDVTIVPRIGLIDNFKAVMHPTVEDMARYISEGERATWPCVKQIAALFRVEKFLSDCVFAVEQRLRETLATPLAGDHRLLGAAQPQPQPRRDASDGEGEGEGEGEGHARL